MDPKGSRKSSQVIVEEINDHIVPFNDDHDEHDDQSDHSNHNDYNDHIEHNNHVDQNDYDDHQFEDNHEKHLDNFDYDSKEQAQVNDDDEDDDSNKYEKQDDQAYLNNEYTNANYEKHDDVQHLDDNQAHDNHEKRDDQKYIDDNNNHYNHYNHKNHEDYKGHVEHTFKVKQDIIESVDAQVCDEDQHDTYSNDKHLNPNSIITKPSDEELIESNQVIHKDIPNIQEIKEKVTNEQIITNNIEIKVIETIVTEVPYVEEPIIISEEVKQGTLIKEQAIEEDNKINIEREEDIKIEEANISEEELQRLEAIEELKAMALVRTKEAIDKKVEGNKLNKIEENITEEYFDRLRKSLEIYNEGAKLVDPLLVELAKFGLRDEKVYQDLLTEKRNLFSNTALAYQRLKNIDEAVRYNTLVYII
jgi:hypothetical protein